MSQLINFLDKEAIKLVWPAGSKAITPYQVLHSFMINIECNTLKFPELLNFGRIEDEEYLIYEHINGDHPVNIELFAKAYSKLIKKMPKPLRISEEGERNAFVYYGQPEVLQGKIQPDMKWTHTEFIPVNLIAAPNNESVYLMDFESVGYRPEFFCIAYFYFNENKIPEDYDLEIFLKYLDFTKQSPDVIKHKIYYNLIGLLVGANKNDTILELTKRLNA